MTKSLHRRQWWVPLAAVAFLAAFSACGDLDEKDTDPPSVLALARWDATHVLALRTYKQAAPLLDLQTGKPTGELPLPNYYEAIAPIGNGRFIAERHQTIDTVDSSGRIDSAIAGVLFTGIAVSADQSTLAYADAAQSSGVSIKVESLVQGVSRTSPTGLYPNVSNVLMEELVLSRDGNLVAFSDGVVTVARTNVAQAGGATVSTCALSPVKPSYGGGPGALNFSPVADTLAVSAWDGSVQVFDVSDPSVCRSLWAAAAGAETSRIRYVRYSRDGALLAVAIESIEMRGDLPFIVTSISLLDATSGALVRSFPIYEAPPHDISPNGSFSTDGPLITDLLWSDAGDRLTVSASLGPVRQYDVATGTLLWETAL